MLGSLSSRPTQIWTLAALYAIAGAMLLFAAAFPISETAPVGLALSLGPVLLVASVAMIWIGPRMPVAALPFLIALGTLFNSIFVAKSTTDYGATLTAFAYIWLAIYAGQFFEQRTVRLQCALIAACSGVAFAITGIPGIVTAWVLVAGSAAVAGETLGRINSRMRAQIATDSLTGLLNRSGLSSAAERAFALASRAGMPVSVALIDLDGFKQVNDRDGHAAGDELLAGLGIAWRNQLRRSEVLARIGGDEFVLVLPGASSTGATSALARLRAAAPVDWSVGVVEWEQGEALERTLERADGELYREKAQRGAGGGREVVGVALS